MSKLKLTTAAVVLTGAAVGSSPAAPQEETDGCQAVVMAIDSEEAGPGQAALAARLSEPIGSVGDVWIEAESQAEVFGVGQSEEDPLVVGFLLDLTSAKPGNWSVVISGESGRCTGVINLGQP